MPMIQKLVDLNGKVINATAIEGDFTLARKFGKVMIGKRALYYKDGLKNICVPFEDMDRAFIRVVGGASKMCCSSMDYEYYRLVVVHGDKEIVDFIVGEDLQNLEDALKYLGEVNENVEIGYVKPEE